MFSLKGEQQRLHGLGQAIAPLFDQVPITFRIALVPKRELLFRRVNRCTDVLARPFGSEGPRFVQQIYVTGGLDLPHEMNAARGDWKPPGWDQPLQFGSQAHQRDTLPHLGRGLALQGWGTIDRVIPALEQWGFVLHLGPIPKRVP